MRPEERNSVPGDRGGSFERWSPGLLLRLTAVFEGATALALLAMPSLPVWALFGQPLDAGMARLGLRLAGAALLALAIACWWIGDDGAGRAARGLVSAMLVYDLLAIGLLLYGRFILSMAGVGLWPAVAAHTALAVWCVAALARRAPASGFDAG